jgi:hypothetical protein
MAIVRVIFHLQEYILSYNSTELNVKEIRPPQMDGSGRSKYPVLFNVWVLNVFGDARRPLTQLMQVRWTE